MSDTMVAPGNLRRLLKWIWRHIATPSTPPSGSSNLYFKSDDKLYTQNSAGVEHEIGGPNVFVTSVTNPLTNAATTTAIVDGYGGVLITLTAAGNPQTIQAPTVTTAGREFCAINNDTSTHSIAVNGVSIAPGEVSRYIWDGTAWLEDTPAGVSNDVTLLTLTGSRTSGSVYSVAASGTNYTMSGDVGNLDLDATTFNEDASISIYLNGAYQHKGVDVVWASTVTFTLNQAVDSGDIITILS
jgi:hypothetical protein